MSETYMDYIGSQSSRIHTGPVKESTRSSGKSLYTPRNRIPWSVELQMELIQYFNSINYPYRNHPDIPFEEPLRGEIRRFLISLDAYKESPNPVIPIRSILVGATHKDYPTYLKRVRRKAFLSTWEAELFEFPEWWNEIPTYIIKDIGDIFNYSYLIFWEEEVDDYKYGFREVSVNPKTLKAFKEHLEGLLPDRDSFNKIDPQEVLLELSGSKSMDRGTDKSVSHYQIKHKYLYFSKKRNLCRRAVVPVSPCNTRDTVINDPSDLNTISLIDRQVMEILRKISGHVHLSDKDRCTRRYKKLYNKYTKFLQRDLQKEGITKPRELLRAMLEVLHSAYPDIRIFENIGFYDEYTLSIDGEVHCPKRGHGLGMANSLTTLMQLTIHELVLDRLLDDIPDIDSDILCINDDFVAGFIDDYHLESYWDTEQEIMEELSLIREAQKSFRTERCFVLAERYFTPKGEYEKISYQLRDLLLPLTCANVTQAKAFFIACQTYVNSRFVGRYIDEIRNFWGYEFYPTEFSYPSVVGGWILEKVNSVDLSLVLLESLEIKSYVFRGFKASQAFPYEKKRGRMFSPPILFMQNNLYVPDEYNRIFDILPMSQINQKYGRLLNSPEAFSRFWDELYKVRQKAFKKPYDITYDELLIQIKESKPATQFYPADSMIKTYHPWDIYQINIDDVYIDPNPKMSCIAKFNSGITYPFREEFSIHFSELDSTTKKSLGLFSKEVQRSLKTEYLSLMFSGRYHEFYWPKGSYEPSEQYLNPIKIGEVTSILNWGKGYPEVYERFRDKLIEKKREIYGRFFSLNELILIKRSGLTRNQLKIVADYQKDSGDSLEDILSYLSDKVRKPKIIPKKEPEKEPDLGNVITVPRLLGEEGSGIFYSWRNCREDWVFGDSESQDALGKLSATVTEYTFPNLRTEDEKKRIKADIEAGYAGDLVRILHKTFGLSSLIDPVNLYETLGLEEGLGLFEDEEGW